MPGKRNYQPLAAPFWPEVIPRFFGPGSSDRKNHRQRESRNWMHTTNGRPPFRPDRDLLFWRDP
jgi:hypothetical protein